LLSRWAVRPDDLLQALNEVRPHVAQFSGHGSKSSRLMLEDKDGNAKPVAEAALIALFRNLKDNIRLVLLNACHSESQARAISGVIECVVGMTAAIDDDAASTFAAWFYGALAFGRSVGEAFEQGRTALMLNGIPEETTPILLTRPGTDALQITFINRSLTNPVLPPVALDILEGAVASNTLINVVRYDGGVAVVAGERQFDCGFDLEQAALLEHAVRMLIQVGWIRETAPDLYQVTHAGYEAHRRLRGQRRESFRAVEQQMPTLIAKMREDLRSEGGESIREFLIMSKDDVLGGSTKPRFVYYEEDHGNLRGKIDVLANRGYVVDVTSKNVLVYRMTDEFVKLLLDEPC
jgi:hypothetical protein